jgi:hypothetical protein
VKLLKVAMHSKFARFSVVFFLLMTMLLFQNCSPFNASLTSPDLDATDPNLNLVAPGYKDLNKIDWSFADRAATAMDINDHRKDWVVSFYGPNQILVQSSVEGLVLHNLQTGVNTSVVKPIESSIDSAIPFFDHGVIFYIEADGISGINYISVFSEKTNTRKRLAEISDNNRCAAYPAERRIQKVICSVKHPTKKGEKTPLLINAETLEMTRLMDTPASLSLDSTMYGNLMAIQYTYKRDAFIYPKQNKAVLVTYDTASQTNKLYTYTENSVSELMETDTDDFFGDGRQLTFSQANAELVAQTRYPSDKSCLGADFNTPDFGSPQESLCTEAGLFAVRRIGTNLEAQMCQSATDCKKLNLIDQGLEFEGYFSVYYSQDFKAIILDVSLLSTATGVKKMFYYEFATKTLKKVFDLHPFQNTVEKSISDENGLSLVTAPKLHKFNSVVTRAQVLLDEKTMQTIPLPFPAVSKFELYNTHLIRDQNFYAAVFYNPRDPSKEVIATTSEMKTISQFGFLPLRSLGGPANKNYVFLQKESAPGTFDIYKWNLKTNTVQFLFSEAGTPGRPLQSIIDSEKYYVLKKQSQTNECTTILRDVQTNQVESTLFSPTSMYCSLRGTFETPTSLLLVNEGTYPASSVHRFDFTTKMMSKIADIKYSASADKVQLAETFYAIGDGLFDKAGNYILTSTDAHIYKSVLGKGELIYGLRSTRNPDATTTYKIVEYNPKTIQSQEITDFTDGSMIGNDSGLYFFATKNPSGISLKLSAKELDLKGSHFSQFGSVISYIRKNQEGRWDFVATDVLALVPTETVITSRNTYGEIRQAIPTLIKSP